MRDKYLSVIIYAKMDNYIARFLIKFYDILLKE